MTSPTTTPLQRRTLIASVVMLWVLTFLGAAPSGPVATTVAPEMLGGDGRLSSQSTMATSFADRFEEVTGQGEEGFGEGQTTAVTVATPVSSAAESASASAADADGVPAAAPMPTLPPVDPVRPALIVRGGDPDTVDALRQVDGVGAVASARVGELAFEGMPEDGPLTVAAVEPLDFRPFTPAITAEADAVWHRVIAGDAAVTHDAGNRLLVPLGAEVMPNGAPEPLRIGAFASNGIPSVADAIVSAELADSLRLSDTHDLYIGLAEGASIDAVTSAVRELAKVGEVEPVTAPVEQQAFLEGSAAAAFFQPFSYVDHGDGLITIDPAWVAENIETRRMPIFTGNVTCHKQFLIQLEGALREVEAAGLAPFIDTTDYGGCWVARHIDWRPDRPLSMHAWGLAVDFNVRTNGLGAAPTMDPRIVAIFDRWGFVWGGRWSRPDGMHFELGAVLTEPSGAVADLTQ